VRRLKERGIIWVRKVKLKNYIIKREKKH
jgi:hypothetical protein